MKKTALLLIAFIVSLTVTAQFKINMGEVKTAPKQGTLEFGYWYKMGDGGYVYTFKRNPVGVMKAIKMTKEILKANESEYDDYDTDDSLISPLVKDMTDYDMLNTTISVGSSTIDRSWRKGDSVLKILLDDDGYMILVVTLSK